MLNVFYLIFQVSDSSSSEEEVATPSVKKEKKKKKKKDKSEPVTPAKSPKTSTLMKLGIF
jgi:hypothetical protein